MRQLFYYKMRQNFITKCDSYHKKRYLLRIVTVHLTITNLSVPAIKYVETFDIFETNLKELFVRRETCNLCLNL